MQNSLPFAGVVESISDSLGLFSIEVTIQNLKIKIINENFTRWLGASRVWANVLVSPLPIGVKNSNKFNYSR